jgi:hypothetical protein
MDSIETVISVTRVVEATDVIRRTERLRSKNRICSPQHTLVICRGPTAAPGLLIQVGPRPDDRETGNRHPCRKLIRGYRLPQSTGILLKTDSDSANFEFNEDGN